MSLKSLLIVSALSAASLSGPALAADLVVNGDFSAGYSGYSTDYVQSMMSPPFQGAAHGIYVIEAASNIASSSAYGDWTNISTDPMGGDGNVYVADGATTNATVWSEALSVKSNTTYDFKFYGAEVSNACCSNASLVPTINGVSGSALNATSSWQADTYTWHSGAATTALLSITDTNTNGPYNDFTIDDLSLTPSAVPEPSTWIMMLMGVGGIGFMIRRAKKTMDVPFKDALSV